jgi:hypothetical protein
MIVYALRLSHEFVDLIRERYCRNSVSYGDESEWTKDSQIEAKAGYFWLLDRLCVPRKSELRLRLITELHDCSSLGLKGVASTLAKALDIFWWKRIRQDVKRVCECCVMCGRAKAAMAATLHLLLVPPTPWHTVSLEYFAHLLLSSNGLVLIVVDHLTPMAHFLPCTKSVTVKKLITCFYMESIGYMDYLEYFLVIATRNSSVAYGIRFGEA